MSGMAPLLDDHNMDVDIHGGASVQNEHVVIVGAGDSFSPDWAFFVHPSRSLTVFYP